MRSTAHHPLKILQTGDLIHFVVRDTHTKDSLVGIKAVVEVDELAVGRPLNPTDGSLRELGPSLGGKFEEPGRVLCKYSITN